LPPGNSGGRRGVQHRGHLLDVDVHQFGGVLGRVRVPGHHHRHRLAHVPHGVGGQHRLQVGTQVGVLDLEPDRDGQAGRQAGRGHHRDHAVGPGGAAGPDRAQPAVRHRGADHPGPELAGPGEVRAEPALAAKQPGVFFASDAGADNTAREVRADHGRSAVRRRRAVSSTASTMPW
jgi:hypothetical protein